MVLAGVIAASVLAAVPALASVRAGVAEEVVPHSSQPRYSTPIQGELTSSTGENRVTWSVAGTRPSTNPDYVASVREGDTVVLQFSMTSRLHDIGGDCTGCAKWRWDHTASISAYPEVPTPEPFVKGSPPWESGVVRPYVPAGVYESMGSLAFTVPALNQATPGTIRLTATSSDLMDNTQRIYSDKASAEVVLQWTPSAATTPPPDPSPEPTTPDPTTSPVPTDPEEDAAPVVETFASRGRGTKATIRYRVFTDVGVTQERIDVYTKRQRKIGTVSTSMSDTESGYTYSLKLNVPRTYRGGAFCVTSTDSAGQVSETDCASLRMS